MNQTRQANKLNVKQNKDKTKKKEGHWIPKEKWNKMTAKQKKAHMNKFERAKDEPQNYVPKKVSKLPSQYTSLENSVMTDTENTS